MRHGPKRMLTCDLCGKKYESKSALIAHMQSWHMKHTFGCDICGRNFSLKRYIRQHMGTHNRKTKCEICRKLVSNMKIHIAARHIYKKKKKLSCPICGLNQTNLKKHINARHVEKPKPFKCDECEENFLYKFERLEHQRKKHGFKTFRCHCGFRSDCATRTRDHKKVHTGKTPTYLCLVSMKNRKFRKYLFFVLLGLRCEVRNGLVFKITSAKGPFKLFGTQKNQNYKEKMIVLRDLRSIYAKSYNKFCNFGTKKLYLYLLKIKCE